MILGKIRKKFAKNQGKIWHGGSQPTFFSSLGDLSNAPNFESLSVGVAEKKGGSQISGGQNLTPLGSPKNSEKIQGKGRPQGLPAELI